jgi:GNAT superfamily N-acetyltransferase
MIFETLSESAARGELLCLDGGFVRWRRRRDGQVTIHEIVVQRDRRRTGIGEALISYLKRWSGGTSILAKCPADLAGGQAFWAAMDFVRAGTEMTRTGRLLVLWRWHRDSSTATGITSRP